jgi:hypothetical protein
MPRNIIFVHMTMFHTGGPMNLTITNEIQMLWEGEKLKYVKTFYFAKNEASKLVDKVQYGARFRNNSNF